MNLPPDLMQQFFDSNGDPLSGGKVYTYAAGTSTLQNTYTDSAGGTPNANPIVLDAYGRCSMWLDASLSYKFVIKDSNDALVKTIDNVVGLLTSDAVTTASLQNGSVTTAKLADNAATSAKVASDASIDANRAIGTNHIKDAAITAPKLAASTIDPITYVNVGLSAAVASNQLTITVTDSSGSALSSSNGARVQFRSATSTSGTVVARTISAPLTLTIPNGASLGTASGVSQYIYVYAIDNASTVELAVAGFPLPIDGTIVNTSLLSASSTDSFTLYSATARTGLAARYIGKIKSSQVTAGTWATAPTEISLKSLTRNTRFAPISGFTLSASFGGATASSFYGRLNGGMLEVLGKFTPTACAASTAYLQLPSSISLDANQLLTTANNYFGLWEIGQAALQSVGGNMCAVFSDGSSTSQLYIATNYSNTFSKGNANSVGNSGQVNSFRFTIPISGWDD